ncbi:MAG TPA: GNAT family N-acetyltransferase [Gemmatimonadaceae bacterium]|nr:GNAT family N-acetyltransferase [Gemmatimonadaceae bacterium]
MAQPPTIATARLILRPFALTDATDVQRLAGQRDIAATTDHIPHPYDIAMAQAWIGSHQPGFEAGTLATFAIVLCTGGELIGAIGLTIIAEHERAELGYWVGKPYWGQGYCTEAAGAVLRYAFEEGGLNRVHACHFARNPASGRVMQKIGMQHEGRLRQHVKKWGQLEDLEMYGVLREEYRAPRSR